MSKMSKTKNEAVKWGIRIGLAAAVLSIPFSILSGKTFYELGLHIIAFAIFFGAATYYVHRIIIPGGRTNEF